MDFFLWNPVFFCGLQGFAGAVLLYAGDKGVSLKERLLKGFRVGAYAIEPLTGTIQGPEGERRVQPKVVEVLLCLAEAQGELVERDELHERIWGRAVVSDDAVTRCISELRRAFNDLRGDPQYIQTLPKRGYRLLQSVAIAGDENAAPDDPQTDQPVAPGVAGGCLDPLPGKRWSAESALRSPPILAKQPSENRTFSFDFGPRLEESETIISVDAVHQRVIDRESGRKSDSNGLDLREPVIDGQVIRLRISGGQDQALYEITFLITTSNEDTVEGEGLLLVVDI